MQAAILAGGLGTRLRPITNKMPKAMVPVNGRPFLEYEIDLLRRNEVVDIVLCLGYLGGVIEEHFGDGSRLGVRIRYSHDGDEPLGPIGGLKAAEDLLDSAFFVTYGDAYLRLDYRGLMSTLLRSGKLGAMAVYKNEGRYGKSDVAVQDGFVTAYDKKKTLPGMVWVNFGVTALRKSALAGLGAGRPCEEEPFYRDLLERRQLLAYQTSDRFYEIGSQRSLAEFVAFISKPARTEAQGAKDLVTDMRRWQRGPPKGE